MAVAALADPVAMPLDRPSTTSFSATLSFDEALAQKGDKQNQNESVGLALAGCGLNWPSTLRPNRSCVDLKICDDFLKAGCEPAQPGQLTASSNR
jgi:hypothetical protein